MDIRALTHIYLVNFKRGKNSSQTKKAYQKLVSIGEKLGIDLNRKFFIHLTVDFAKNSEKYKDVSEEEMNNMILKQMQAFISEYEMRMDSMKEKNKG